MADYDVADAFTRIENELIASMIRNMKRHKVEEITENKQWSQWQVEQLKSLDEYKKLNKKKYGSEFKNINDSISGAILAARQEGNMEQEIAILNAIKKGFQGKKSNSMLQGQFIKANDRKIDALINETTKSLEHAETAILRLSNDRYRKVIFNAQMYAASGSGTYEQAVDMATKDYLNAGLNCVEYKNGRRVTLDTYAKMAVQTACKRAYLTGEGEKRREWGVFTVILNRRTDACPKCLPFEGKVFIDDVWSGGSDKDGRYPLLSAAIAAGLYHPNCRDAHTTYFPGISSPPKKPTKTEVQESVDLYNEEQEKNYFQNNAGRMERLAKYSLDKGNRIKYRERGKQWKEKVESISNRGIIKAGGISGARNPFGKEAEEHAERYYNLVRSMKTDVDRISKNISIPKNKIQEVKDYIFYTKHDLGGNELEYFEPDFMMAQSWERLIHGKNIRKHDITLIKHEMMEKELIDQGGNQFNAHIKATEKYNYDKEAKEFYANIEKFKENK